MSSRGANGGAARKRSPRYKEDLGQKAAVPQSEHSASSKGERLCSRGCYRAGTAKRTIVINLVVFVVTNDAEVTKRDRRGRPKCLSSISLGTTHPVSPRQVATHCEAQALSVQPPLTSCRHFSSGGGRAWGARGCGEPPRSARAQPWSGWPRRCSSTPCGRAWGARRLWRWGKGRMLGQSLWS